MLQPHMNKKRKSEMEKRKVGRGYLTQSFLVKWKSHLLGEGVEEVVLGIDIGSSSVGVGVGGVPEAEFSSMAERMRRPAFFLLYALARVQFLKF